MKIDHRTYIDGLVIELTEDGVTVATHYTVPNFIERIRLETLLTEAALDLQRRYGVPFAVIVSEDVNG